MREFNIANFIKMFTGVVSGHESQESIGIFMLEQIGKRDNVRVNVTKSMVSKLCTQKTDVHQSITAVVGDDALRTDLITFFDNEILRNINEYKRGDTIDSVAKLLDGDSSCNDELKEKILSYYTRKQHSVFLARAFLYAISRPNEYKTDDVSFNSTELYLVNEERFTCPLCGKQLIKKARGGLSVPQYSIVSIFPENLSINDKAAFIEIEPEPIAKDALGAKMALCLDCGNEYKNAPSAEMYRELVLLKKQKEKEFESWNTIETFDIEQDINDVIDKLNNIHSDGESVVLSENPVLIKHKIPKDNKLLQERVVDGSLKYYSFIESLFSKKDANSDFSFTDLVREVRKIYIKLKTLGNGYEEIVDYLTRLFIGLPGIGESYSSACFYIVCFFIQNCEVFDEIAE